MDIKNELNEKQYLACSSTSKYLRIIAGAGTGKTRVLTYRIAYLISLGMSPNRILAITFTRKAADEMQERVKNLLEENHIESEKRPYINNFHGFCYRFLKQEISNLHNYNRNFQVVDEEDRKNILKDIFKDMSDGNSKNFAKNIMSKISNLKNDGIKPEEVTKDDIPMGSDYTLDQLVFAYSKYQQYLSRQNLLDFDDLLLYTLEILENNKEIRNYYSNKYDIIFVDEFQDTNIVQYKLLKYLIGPKTCLTVVGDPDQTIYTWRGAQNDIIKDKLKNDFKDLDTIVLDDNYRSTQMILDLSNMLIKNNIDRLDKDLHAANNIEGEKPTYKHFQSAEDEGRYIATNIYRLVSSRRYQYKDIAVLYRASAVSRAIEGALGSYSIPYKVYGGMKFFERAEIKDMLSYLRFLYTHDDLSLRRILKFPSRGLGDTSIENALSFASKLPDEENNLYTVLTKYSDQLKIRAGVKENLIALFNITKNYEKLFLSYNDDVDEIQSLIRKYLTDVGFFSEVKAIDKKEEESKSYTDRTSSNRMDNVNELLSMINSYFETDEIDEDGNKVKHSLSDFLIELAIQSTQDQISDEDSVTLMTSHVSKGLEFKVVFIAGLSDNIFPSVFAIKGTKSQMEEERRLLYVSITRARELLYLSSRGGYSYGGVDYTPSRFLKEIGYINKDDDNPLTNLGNRNSSYNSYSKGNSYYRSTYPSKNNYSSTPSNSSYKQPEFKVGANRVNYNPNNSIISDDYKVGDEIIHTTYGTGKVINVEKRDGKPFLTIIFDEIGTDKNVTKKLIPNKFSMSKKK